MTQEARQTLNNAIAEKQFQQTIIDLAKINGWLTYHDYDSRRSTPGFPDLVLVGTGKRQGRLIFAELKTQKGSLKTAQQTWINNLSETQAEVYIWKPEHWNQIEKTLTQ